MLSDYTSNSNIDATHVHSSTHPVTITKYPSAVNSNTTQYPGGVINPIQKKTITKIINIDSIFRPNYKGSLSTNFMWSLMQRETNVVSMRVSSVDIPVLWYSITDKLKRNEFEISLYDDVDTLNRKHLITIPPGNYMSDTFTNMLNTIFKKQGWGLEYLIADVDINTSKTIIRAVDKDDIKGDATGLTTHAAFDPNNDHYLPGFWFKLDFFPQLNDYNDGSERAEEDMYNEYKRTVGWYMGFCDYTYEVRKANKITQITFDPFHSELYYECAVESESSYSSSRDNYIFLNVDDYNSNCVCESIVSNTNNGYIGNNILARITVDAIHNSVLYDNGRDLIFKERVYMGPVTIEKMKISLINRYGEVIDINSNNFSLTLELTKLY